MSVNELQRLAKARYVSLTTQGPDASTNGKQVWVVRDGDALVVALAETSPEISQIQADSNVRLAPCDLRGRPQGSATPGTAQIRPAVVDLETYKDLAKRKYDWPDFFIAKVARLGKPKDQMVTVRISLTDK